MQTNLLWHLHQLKFISCGDRVLCCLALSRRLHLQAFHLSIKVASVLYDFCEIKTSKVEVSPSSATKGEEQCVLISYS